MVKVPTRITQTSETMIDLIMTNRPESITRTYNLIKDLSDHNMTLIVRKLTKQHLTVFMNERRPKLGNVVIPKKQQFDDELNNTDWNDVLQTTDIDSYSYNIIMKTHTGLIIYTNC